jgi:hypothetical protein
MTAKRMKLSLVSMRSSLRRYVHWHGVLSAPLTQRRAARTSCRRYRTDRAPPSLSAVPI